MGLRYFAAKVGAHPKTIGDLARGEAELTLTWMQRLARVYGVKAIEIIEKPTIAGLRTVIVTGTVQAGTWADNHVSIRRIKPPSRCRTIPTSETSICTRAGSKANR
jgi:hypothetical protein